MRDNQKTDLPDNRSLGDTMNYTSGTTGNPKGVRRALSGVNPDDAAIGLGGLLLLFGIQSRDDNVHIVGSPLYHTAVLRFSGAAIHMGHTVVLMDKWTGESMLERSSATGSPIRTWCPPSSTDSWLCPRRPVTATTCRRCDT
jgi:long-chain acyl-CoA synthetase